MKKTNKPNGTSENKTPADPTALEEATKFIRQILEQSNKDEALARYEIGQKVNETCDLMPKEKYGDYVVRTLAEAVKLTGAALYSYAKVAKEWRRGKVQEYVRRGVTFSHFIELTHPDHAERRDALLERAAAEKLSVANLKSFRKRSRVDVLARLAAEGPSESLRQELEKKLADLREEATRLAREIQEHELELGKHFVTAIADESSEIGTAAE